MALGRLEAKVISRGSGHSAVAKSAYNSREAIFAERYDKREDYSRKDDCLFSGFYAPKDAPEWAQSRGRFWNAVEWREKRKDAQLGREFEIAIPHELDTEQARRLLQDFVRENFVRKGYAADVAIHKAREDSDERNIHAHVFVPLRRIEGGHWAEKKDRPSEFERKAELKELRADWEKRANKALERYGFAARIDMRSYAERGLDRVPGVHLGKEAAGMERRGVETELGNRNRAAANENTRRAANENDRSAADIEQARELAAFVVQQRKGIRAQDEERARVMWDQPDGSTLSNVRKREADDAKRGSMDGAARRALDELARVDPIGTARHFGHHAGDRLKSSEDMRRETAEQIRDVAADPVPTHSQVDAKPRPSAEDRFEQRMVMMRLRQHQQEARREAQGRPGPSMLRAALTALQTRLAAITGRLEQARTAAVLSRSESRPEPSAGPTQSREREPLQPTQGPRHEISSAEANRRLAEGFQEGQREEQARQRENARTAAAEARMRPAQGPGEVKKPSADFADELLKQARAVILEQKARDIERQRDEQSREMERVRELLRQDWQTRRPDEPA